jgi:hypothetical protein
LQLKTTARNPKGISRKARKVRNGFRARSLLFFAAFAPLRENVLTFVFVEKKTD